MPAEGIVRKIVELIGTLNLKEPPTHVGIGMPGIVRNGVVEDSPNLVQLKGANQAGGPSGGHDNSGRRRDA